MARVRPLDSTETLTRTRVPRIVAFTCNWCSYSGADMAGTARLGYAPNVRVVRMLCSGRLDPVFVLKAFEEGADGVLVSGCHPGDCHYVQGNLYARRRLQVFADLMDFLGLDSRRLHFAWVSASEGVKWSRVINQVTEAVIEAGPVREWPSPAFSTRVAPDLEQAAEAPRPQPSPEEYGLVTGRLRELASQLLSSGEVHRVIGYSASPGDSASTPVFIEQPEESPSLIWNERCSANLATYLAGPTKRAGGGRTAILAKACDARSIAGLLRENQLKREDVVIIGVTCSGIWSKGRMAAKCYSCSEEATQLADWTVSADATIQGQLPLQDREIAPDPREAEIQALSALPADERLSFWRAEFDRCIRCYACRSACPLCYCETCITDKTRPQWIPVSQDGPGNFAWNVTRAMHLAGRCADCDECARACPSDIRLDLINRSIALGIEHKLGMQVSSDPAAQAALTTYRPDDPDGFR